MAIDAERVRRIAELARLELTAEEAAASTEDLNAILELVERMRTLDTTGVAPLAHPLDARARLREDRVTEPDRRDALLAGAPEVQDGLFVVPRVIE